MRAIVIMVWAAFLVMFLTLLGAMLVQMAREAPVLFGLLVCAAGALGWLAHKARSTQPASGERECDPARASSTR